MLQHGHLAWNKDKTKQIILSLEKVEQVIISSKFIL